METCKKCGGRLIKKATKRTAEQLQKSYYYSAYYYCPHCKKLYHDNKFKVTNKVSQAELAGSSSLPSYDVEIWTDGACINNGKPNARAAWAFVAHSAVHKSSKEDSGHAGKIEGAGLVEGKQTNNTAEALAIYYALVWAASMQFQRIKLYTDSQISIHGVKKPPAKVLKNREIFEQIASVISKQQLKVDFIKVLGHSGDPNNEQVDKLANSLARSG
jgi:ribonuclease HI